MAQGDAKALAAGSCLLLGLLASPVVSLQALLDTRANKFNPQPFCSNLPSFPHFTSSKDACILWPDCLLPEI